MARGDRHLAAAPGIASQLRGKPCQTHTSDLRIRIPATGLATYPDVSVICGHVELDPEDRLGHTALNPTLLVEVLSPSTEEYDRTEKREHYQQLPSLRELVLVAQNERRVEVWRRDAAGDWQSFEARSGAVELASIGAALELDDIYRDPLAS